MLSSRAAATSRKPSILKARAPGTRSLTLATGVHANMTARVNVSPGLDVSECVAIGVHASEYDCT